jgi:hypothetical protein
VVGAIVGLIALGSGGGDDKETKPVAKAPPPPVDVPYVPPVQPTEPPPQPVDTTPDPDPTPPQPVEPTAEERETEAARALFEAEQWARRNWNSDEDNERVVTEYRKVRTKFPGTAVAREIDARIREIRAGERHAHPDRSLAPSADIEAIRTEWNRVKPEIEKKIAQHAYIGAKRLVPAGSVDGLGPLGRDLAFWRGFLTHLIQFKTSLAAWAPKLGEERRTIPTKIGTGPVEKLTAQHITVLIDGKKEKVLWTDVEPATLAALSRRAFQDAPAKCAMYSLAFAYAHRLWEVFWAAEFDISMEADASQGEGFMLREYKRRQEELSDGN